MNDNVLSIKNIIKEKFPESEWGNNGSVQIYSSVEEEYHSLTKGVGIRNISHNVQLKLTGGDTLDFLNRISTNKVKDLELFQHKNTLFTTEKGRLIDRTTLFKFGEFFLLLGSPDKEEKLKSWLDKYIIMEDIKVEESTGEFAFFELIGPQSKSFMTFLCGDKIGKLDGSTVVMGDTDTFKTYVADFEDIRDIERFWVMTGSENTDSLVEFILKNKSVFDLSFVGEEAYEIYRVEKGIPAAPNEINDQFNPHEVDLIHEVDFTKGCYIGQEVIARLDTYDKVQRQMVGVKFNDGAGEISELPADIYTGNDKSIGILTSCVNSTITGNQFGIGLVKKKLLDDENKCFVRSSGGKETPVSFTNLPLES